MRLSLFFSFIFISLFSLKASEIIKVIPSMSSGELQRKISNANSNDIIRFSPGTYTLSNSLSINKSITLEGTSTSSETVLFISSDNIRHISATTGKIRIKNITFQVSSNNIGGGIEYLGQDSLLISNCEFVNNKNRDGGAIYSFGHIFVDKSTFSSNTAMVAGGAIYTRGKAFVSNSFFSDNNAAQGGAIFNQSRSVTRIEPVDVIKCTFLSNMANQGGAIWSENPIEAQSCVFLENYAKSDNGGALYTTNTVTASGTIFYKNRSNRRGAGLFAERFINISECFFMENTATDFGGAVCNDYFNNASVEEFNIIKSSVFTKNVSGRGGAIYSSLSLIVMDCTFERNDSRSSGGAVFCDKNLVLNRTSFEENNALNEGGAVDALKAKVTNSTLVGNSSQNASAIHAHEDINVIFSTFAGNRAILKSGGVIHGQNVILYANIISGNLNQDKITGKIRENDYNVIGSNNIQNTFEYLGAGNVPILNKIPGYVPMLPIKISGNAYNKIPSGQIQKWEKEIGITDFLFLDQLKNKRGLTASTDIGAVLANTYLNAPQVPMIDLDRMLADVYSKRKPVTTAIAQTTQTVTVPPPPRQEQQLQQTEPVQQKIHVQDVQPQKEDRGERTTVQVENDPVPTPTYPVEEPLRPSSTASFDDDLDRIIDAIYADNINASERLEQPVRPTNKTETSSSQGKGSSLADLVRGSSSERSSSTGKQSEQSVVREERSSSKVENQIGNSGLGAQLVFNEQPKTEGDRRKSDESSNKSNTQLIDLVSSSSTSLSDNAALSGVYTIDGGKAFGDRNFTSLEEAVNLLNSRGNKNDVHFVITPGVYLIHKPITISNASHPITLSGNSSEEPVILRSSGNNRVIVIAVDAPVKMKQLIFEGPEGASMGKSVKNGGGISCNTNALLTFEECVFRYNKNQMGGGVFARNVFVSKCSFYDNISSDGGGIYASECTTINSTFYGNKSAAGGGIYAKDKAIAVFCTFAQNEANGKASAIFAPSVHLYGSISTGNKSKSDFEGELDSNFSNILDNVNPFNVFANFDAKGVIQLETDVFSPTILIKPGGVAAEQISESLLLQWEDELNLNGLLSTDQEGKRRPQNRNAEIGAWETPFKRGN